VFFFFFFFNGYFMYDCTKVYTALYKC